MGARRLMGRVYDEQEVTQMMRDLVRDYALDWATRCENAAELSEAAVTAFTRTSDPVRAAWFQGAAHAQRMLAEELRVAVIRDRADEARDAA